MCFFPVVGGLDVYQDIFDDGATVYAQKYRKRRIEILNWLDQKGGLIKKSEAVDDIF